MMIKKNGKNGSSKNNFNPSGAIIGKFPFLKSKPFQLWALAIVFSFLCSSLIIPQVYLLQPEFTIGSIAKQNIKADHAFLVLDDQGTENKRREALKKVRPVFDYNPQMAEEITMELTRAFELLINTASSNARDSNEQEFNQLKTSFEKKLNVPLSSAQFRLLITHRNHEDMLLKLKTLVQEIYQGNYISERSLPKAEADQIVIISNLHSGRQEEIDTSTHSILRLGKVGSIIRHRDNQRNLIKEKKEIQQLIIHLAARLIRPNLTYNQQATQLYRQKLIAEAQPVYSQILKNEMLVREGQRITAYEAAKLETYYNEKGERWLFKILKFIGVFFVVLLLSIILFRVAKRWQKPEIDFRGLLFLAATTLLQVIIIKTGFFLAEAVNQTFPSISAEAFYYSIPFGVGAMLIVILINHNMAILFTVFTLFFVAILFDGKMSMALYFFIGSIAVANYLRECRRRSAFFRAGLYLGAVNCLAIIIISALSGDFTFIDLFLKLLLGLIGGIVSGFIVAGMTPVFETIFDYTTEFRLMELANLNNPLFQRMIIEAPGTYHHSIIVASLVEGAAQSIGANPLLAKVSAYYHDIGKLKKPRYFIENQTNGENIHDRLSSKMSSLVIISHVKEGAELAAEMKLGNLVSNIIRQHHGNSLVGYFWEKGKRENNTSNTCFSENDFRYPGPKPQTREAGLVLLGDVIEASSRVLKNPTPARINNLVRDRIEKVFLDGQLDECEITLRDLNIISETFIKILTGMFHSRIDYPDSAARESTFEKRETHENSDQKPPEKTKAGYSLYPEFSDPANEGPRTYGM